MSSFSSKAECQKGKQTGGGSGRGGVQKVGFCISNDRQCVCVCVCTCAHARAPSVKSSFKFTAKILRPKKGSAQR